MSDITILEEIRLLASELSDMSPKTQLEIVKLCKNICLKTRDYLDGVVEDIENETERATAKENEIIDDLHDETLRATGVESGLNTRLIALENQIGYVELNNNSGTLTNEQYAEILKPNCIIEYESFNFFGKSDRDGLDLYFKCGLLFNNQSSYKQIQQLYVKINLSTKAYQVWGDQLDLYDKAQADALLNNKQNTLEFNPLIPSGTTPAPLSNLKDGENYYALGGSTGHCYSITVTKSGSPNYHISLIIGSTLDLTATEINNLLTRNIYDVLSTLEITNGTTFLCTGFYSTSSCFYYGQMDTINGIVKFYHDSGNINSLSTSVSYMTKLI